MSSADRRSSLPPGAGLLVPELQPEPFEIRAVQPSPCAEACPAGINVKAYVSLIAEGRFAEALEVVRERCPLPGVCGRVCHHPCETACRRGESDQPVAIRALKRFVADLETQLPDPPLPPPVDRPERVAVIGSGPAGLTAAYDLRRAGHAVTVFEAEPEAGGMLRYGIADYRLPPDVLDAEIGVLERAGVEIVTERRIGVDETLEELLGEGYAALILAVGAQRGRRLGIEGEDGCDQLEDALAFLRRVNRGDRTPIGGRVLVIGGGSTAIETARAARRLGAEAVEIVYRRQRAEMPADEEEIELAAAEGITFRYLTLPTRVVASGGKLESLECLEVALGEEDDSGRRRPIALPGSEFSIAADRVFAAVGQHTELEFLPAEVVGRLAERGLLVIDPETAMTGLHGVFAAGDVVSGPATVIDAIAAGHRAAEAVLEFLESDSRSATGRPPRSDGDEYEIPLPPPPPLARARPPHDGIRAGAEFAEVEGPFSPAAAIAEARRCLRCGPCGECLVCAPSCSRRHLSVRPAAGDSTAAPVLLRAPARVAAALEGAAEPAGLVAEGWIRCAEVDPMVDWSVTVTPARVSVDAGHCRGCARCLEVCSFDALRLVDPSAAETTVEVDAARCRGCNLCAGVCPTDAILASAVAPGWWGTGFDDLDLILAAAKGADAPRVVLACQRRAAAVERSLARRRERGRPSLLVPIRCAGQVPAGRLLEIYRRGAAAVVLAGCASGHCRFGCGPQLAAGQMLVAVETLEALGADGSLVSADWAGDEDLGLDLGSLSDWADAIERRPEA